jgi:MoaA/NifB/PqqE/SkfB family radical SAM enzyme
MGPIGGPHRILQVHPTRRCNLRCLHCYSSSGPGETDALDSALLISALEDAHDEGYTALSVSGGEPLLYGALRALLEFAQAHGMRTALTTNGMLLDARRLDALKGVTDLIAISLDGTPESHNRNRGSDRAFLTMAARLAGLREREIPFGFIFTLTQQNLHELDWVARFAVEQGAALLQIHPLEEVGRAHEELPGVSPDAVERAWAFVEAARLQRDVGERLLVQLDLVHRRHLLERPERIFAQYDTPAIPTEPTTQGEDRAVGLAHLVAPLVIEADGTVVPVTHGLARTYALGNLYDSRLRDLAREWASVGYHAFRRLCQRVAADLAAHVPKTSEDPQAPIVDWYDLLARAAATARVS